MELAVILYWLLSVFEDNLEVGEGVTGVVLDIDCQRIVIDISLKQDLVSCFDQTSRTQKHNYTSSTDLSHQVICSCLDLFVHLVFMSQLSSVPV